MLIQRVFLASVCIALYSCNVTLGDDSIQVNVTVGDTVYMTMPSPIGAAKCMVQMNTGEKFSLLSNERPMEISQSIMDEMSRTCSMRINSAQIAHSGEWTIQAYTIRPLPVPEEPEKPEDGEEIKKPQSHVETEEPEYDITTARFLVRVTQNKRVDVSPARTISIFTGNSMILQMANRYENMTRCIATLPNKNQFDVFEATVSQPKTDIIHPFGQCGVIVKADTEHTGLWRLDAWFGEYVSFFGTFAVQVQHIPSASETPTVTHLQIGEPASIIIGPKEATSCRLRTPSGQNLPIRSANCRVDISAVTRKHQGRWTATYTLSESVQPIIEVTDVELWEDRPMNATVTTMANGEVNLLCSFRAFSVEFCHFIRPDEEIINAVEGIGNDRYIHYGAGIQSSRMITQEYHECGITILKPNLKYDYGSWKCLIGTSTGLIGTILRLPGSYIYGETDEVQTEGFGADVLVPKGRKYTISCKANGKLDYCWLRSPNGTSYSVSSTVSSPTTLGYTGMGLSLGECGAIIPSAEETDNGQWRCNMGISGRDELTTRISVVVSESLLHPTERKVEVLNQQAHLIFYLISGYGESIEYCRCIHPDGFGVHEGKGERYHLLRTDDRCSLTIDPVTRYYDTGNWTCIASLTASSAEVSTTIEVLEMAILESYPRSTIGSWCIGLGVALISVAASAIILLFILSKLQRRRATLDLPPKYKVNGLRMPPGIITTAYGSR